MSVYKPALMGPLSPALRSSGRLRVVLPNEPPRALPGESHVPEDQNERATALLMATARGLPVTTIESPVSLQHAQATANDAQHNTHAQYTAKAPQISFIEPPQKPAPRTLEEEACTQDWLALISRYPEQPSANKPHSHSAKQLHRAIHCLIARGVPDALRTGVWRHLLGLRCPAFQLPRAVCSRRYEQLIATESTYEIEIAQDIARMARHGACRVSRRVSDRCTDTSREKGAPALQEDDGPESVGNNLARAALPRILRAVANCRPSVGYCQGLGDVAAMILEYFHEEESFEVLVCLLDDGLASLFDTQLSGLQPVERRLRRHLRRVAPRLLRHIEAQNADMMCCVAGWSVTLYTRAPDAIRRRFWDFLMFYGAAAVPCFGAALLWTAEDELCACFGDTLLVQMCQLLDSALDEHVLFQNFSTLMLHSAA